MAKGASYIKEHEAALAERSKLDTTYKDCFDFTYPILGAGLQSAAEAGSAVTEATGKKVNKNFDSTAAEACRLIASAVLAGLTPANAQWFLLHVAPRPGRVGISAHAWLDDTAKAIWQAIHDGNYDSVGMQVFLNWAIGGWSPMYVDLAEDQSVRCEFWPMHECTLGQSRRDGPADIIRRKFKLTATQAENEYGRSMLPAGVLAKLVAGSEDQDEYLWVIRPRAGGIYGSPRGTAMPIESCTVHIASKKIVRESGFQEHPVPVPRWLPLPNSAYAIGPMYEALADTKTLNEVVRFVLMNADLAIAGMWIAEDDGVLNPRTIQIGPRKVVVANSVESMKPLQPSAKFDVAFLQQERLETKIRRMLLADQLQLPNNDRMTATEIEARLGQLRNMLAPILGRLQSEFLQPFIARVYSLLLQSGQIQPPPEELQRAGSLSIRYVSPLARQQRAAEVNVISQFEADLIATAEATQDAGILDLYDFDESKREKARLQGVPLRLLRNTAQIKARRDGRDRAIAAANKAAANEAGLEAAADQILAGAR